MLSVSFPLCFCEAYALKCCQVSGWLERFSEKIALMGGRWMVDHSDLRFGVSQQFADHPDRAAVSARKCSELFAVAASHSCDGLGVVAMHDQRRSVTQDLLQVALERKRLVTKGAAS